jgi:hypothetical protein
MERRVWRVDSREKRVESREKRVDSKEAHQIGGPKTDWDISRRCALDRRSRTGGRAFYRVNSIISNCPAPPGPP